MQLSGYSPATVLRHALTALLLATLIAGCSSTPRRGAETVSPVQQQARVLESSGDYAGAALLYIKAASRATAGHEQQTLQLQAADSLIRGEDFAAARRLLDEMPPTLASNNLQQHYRVNRAALALAEQHPVEALALLDKVPADGTYAADLHRLRAEAYLQEYRYFLSARERVQLDPLLADPDAQLENEFAIWETLNRLTDAELQQLRTAPPPDPLSGWMELVELSRLYLQQPDALAEVTPHWQQRYPDHPATQAFIPKLLESMSLAGQAPAHIALLLPLNGTLAEAAAAIRDGVLAAYYDTPDTALQPRLQIIDSGDTADTALAAYQQAVLDGAQFVIGPLRKEAVQALAMQPQLAVPVLSLNQIEEPALFNPALYQFGLAPEDEAREVARLAWREGYTRSIALLPESEWGERVYTAFCRGMGHAGGGDTGYPPLRQHKNRSWQNHQRLTPPGQQQGTAPATDTPTGNDTRIRTPATRGCRLFLPHRLTEPGAADSPPAEILPRHLATRLCHFQGIQRSTECSTGCRHERYRLL